MLLDCAVQVRECVTALEIINVNIMCVILLWLSVSFIVWGNECSLFYFSRLNSALSLLYNITFSSRRSNGRNKVCVGHWIITRHMTTNNVSLISIQSDWLPSVYAYVYWLDITLGVCGL
jgi:hypothetical protein